MDKCWRVTFIYLLFLGQHAYGQNQTWEQVLRASETLQEQGQAAEAEKLLLTCLHNAPDLPHLGLARIYNNLASVVQDQGRYADAERHYRLSLRYWESAGPQHQLGAARTLNNLASLLWFVGRMQEAEKALQQSLNVHVALLGSNHPETTVVFSNLGTFQLKMRKWSEAETAFRQALANSEGTTPVSREVGWIYYGLALVCRSTNRSEEADGLFRKSQTILEQYRQKGELEPQYMVQLAVSYRFTNQPKQFESLLRDALAAIAQNTRITPVEQVVLLTACARELKQFPQTSKEAREMENQARRIQASDTQLRMINETIHINALVESSGSKPR